MVSANELLRNQAARQRILQERKSEVCSAVHPEYTEAREARYNFLPERCTRKPAVGTTRAIASPRRRRAPARSLSLSREQHRESEETERNGSRNRSRDNMDSGSRARRSTAAAAASASRNDPVKEMLREERTQVTRLARLFPADPFDHTPPVTENMQETKKELLYQFLMNRALQFVLEMFPVATSLRSIRREPDVKDRVDGLVERWRDGKIHRSTELSDFAKRRMYALMKSHYGAMDLA